MDRALQTVQDTIRLPFYETENIHRSYGVERYYDQYFQNLIPEFVVDQANGAKEQILTKRQGLAKIATIGDWMTGIVNDKDQCWVVDFITVTALYDVMVAAVFDTSNDKFYIIQIRPNAGTSTKIGEFTAASGDDDFCFLTEYTQSNAGSLYPAIAVSWTNSSLTSSKGYTARSSAGVFAALSLTEITSVGFPPKQTPALISIGRFIWLNGTMYVASLDGRIWNSYAGQNDATTWLNATSQIGSISLNSYTDQVVGLARYKHHVVAFGRNSIEFFNDVGDTPCPLARTDQAFIKFGAKNQRLIKNVNDVLYWTSYSEHGTPGVWMLDGYTPVKISNANIDTIITAGVSTADSSNCNIQSCIINQKPQLILNGFVGYSMMYPYFNFSSGSDTYSIDTSADTRGGIMCFNIEDKTWWFMNSKQDLGMCIYPSTEFPLPSASQGQSYMQVVLTSNTQGVVAGRQYAYYFRTDNIAKDDVPDSLGGLYPSYPITTIAQVNFQWFQNEKRKRVNKFKLICQPPVRASGDANTYSLYLSYVRDNYQEHDTNGSVVNAVLRSITIPATTNRLYFNNLGMGRTWTFHVMEKSPMNIIYRSLELDIQQGTH